MTRDLLLLIVLGSLGLFVFLVVRSGADRIRVARRLQLAGGKMGESLEHRLADSAAGVRGAAERVFTALGGFMPLGEEDRHKIALSLRRAGIQSNNAVMMVLGTKVVCLLVGLVVGIVMMVRWKSGATGWGLGVVVGFIGGIMLNLLPELVISKIAAKQLWRIQSALPDAVDLLVVCLEAGLTFERALRRTVSDLESFHPALAVELGQATLDMSVHGRSREESLTRVADRLDSQELRDLAVTVAQAERHGTPTADALRTLANSVRVDTIAHVQAKMARLPTLLILPSIAFLLPGVMVIIGGPAFMQLAADLSSIAD